MNPIIRDFEATDATSLNSVAVAAFMQFKNEYSDWPAMVTGVSRMSELSGTGEVIVAELDDNIVGGVVYVPAGARKADYFDQSWPVIRMLVVDPAHRGLGVGKRLTDECLRRACRDGATLMALHTSPIMGVALPMYLRMGFQRLRDAPSIHDVPYSIYTKKL